MDIYLYTVAIGGYLILCMLNGWISHYKRLISFNRHFGFWTVFYASFFLTPLIVFAVLLFIPNRPEKRDRQ